MTFAILALVGGLLTCYLLARGREAPSTVEDWNARLHQEGHRLMGALELQTGADEAMATDALRKAVRARDSRAFGEALRLVDLAYEILAEATSDRRIRLRGMQVCLRMAAAVCPEPPLLPVGAARLREVRALFGFGALAQAFLVGAMERMMLRLMLLRVGYDMTLRAFSRSRGRLTRQPELAQAWRRCDDAVSDFTRVLDPAHVDAYRALLASALERV